jgi:hypothetical protein
MGTVADEALLPVLDPLEGAPQAHGRPRQEHLLGVEHHDLGPEAAADERGDDSNLGLEQAQHGG